MPYRPEDRLPFSEPDDQKLAELLRREAIALSPFEARRLVSLLGREPTLAEATLFAIMWSEHCSYKSSRPLLKKYLPTEGPTVIQGPAEDAGILDFGVWEGVRYGLVIAHESHNHPSQVMPYEGAATGIGGIVRDVYCMGGDVLAVLDPLRFGNPTRGERQPHPRDHLRRGGGHRRLWQPPGRAQPGRRCGLRRLLRR